MATRNRHAFFSKSFFQIHLCYTSGFIIPLVFFKSIIFRLLIFINLTLFNINYNYRYCIGSERFIWLFILKREHCKCKAWKDVCCLDEHNSIIPIICKFSICVILNQNYTYVHSLFIQFIKRLEYAPLDVNYLYYSAGLIFQGLISQNDRLVDLSKL